HLEPAPPCLVRRGLRQRGLARPRGAHEGQQPARAARRAVQQEADLLQLTPPAHYRHIPGIPPAPDLALLLFEGATSGTWRRCGPATFDQAVGGTGTGMRRTAPAHAGTGLVRPVSGRCTASPRASRTAKPS